MNFVTCGADPCQVYEEISATTTSSPAVNPSTKKRNSSLPSDFEICHQRLMFDREDEEVNDDESSIILHSSSSATRSGDVQTVSTALDNIQQTLDEQRDYHPHHHVLYASSAAPSTPPRYNTDSPDRVATALACSPSPNMLNPLSKEDCFSSWRSLSPKLPRLDTSTPYYGLEILTRRMAEGYDVKITKAPWSSLAGMASLSLSEDWRKLYLARNTSRDGSSLNKNIGEEKKEDNKWVEIHTSTIRRIHQGEAGREMKSSSTCAFSLAVEHSTTKDVCEYYDLEATSAIDREVIVTTILLILDKESEGTLDQPIPCSPSLEPHSNTMFSSDPPGKSFSLTSDSFDDLEMPIVSNEKSMNSRDKGDLHYEHQPSDFLLQCAPSASSLNLAAANSTAHHQPGTWCSADTCTFALHDITDTCAGIFALKQSHCLAPQQRLVEEFITTALGSPHAFYNCFSDGGYWEKEENNNATTKRSTSTLNRASRLNAQAARLRSLRNEMSFAAALKQSKSTLQSLRTVKSYDSSAIRRHKATDKAAIRIHASPLLESLVGKMAVFDDNGDSKDQASSTGGSLYYDSDPEDYRTQTRRPRTVPAPSSESFEERSMLNWVDYHRVGHHHRKLSRKIDDDTIREITQAMMNERLELLWHPTQSANCPNLSPLGVKVWIESGVYLNDGNFLLPKLTWAKASSTTILQRLDLLDICRICPMDNVDRTVHPFVLTKQSFFVETQTDILVFQANNAEARDRIVFSLKLVVARLASLLMLRDMRAAEEFFSTTSAHVPGEAPEWT